MTGWVLVVCVAAAGSGGTGCDVDAATVARVTEERVTGSLVTAEAEARRLLECPDLAPADRLALQLELARILDRFGLHHNTRPVAEALEILQAAESEAAPDDAGAQSKVLLALAESYYRAEMGDREFPTATDYAVRAEALCRELRDPVCETDAVHRLGLIALQQRRLDEARRLFDRSLGLSQDGPERLIFLSDYHRHIGFVDMLEDDLPTAIEHFERSLKYRDEAGSRDYGLFARTMLASALIAGGRAAEARPSLEQAMEIARDLPSPVGELRAMYNLGTMHEALKAYPDALRWYRQAVTLADDLGVLSIGQSARDGEQRVLEMTADQPAVP